MSLHPGTGWRISRKSRSRVPYLHVWYRECRIYMYGIASAVFMSRLPFDINFLSQCWQDPITILAKSCCNLNKILL